MVVKRNARHSSDESYAYSMRLTRDTGYLPRQIVDPRESFYDLMEAAKQYTM